MSQKLAAAKGNLEKQSRILKANKKAANEVAPDLIEETKLDLK